MLPIVSNGLWLLFMIHEFMDQEAGIFKEGMYYGMIFLFETSIYCIPMGIYIISFIASANNVIYFTFNIVTTALLYYFLTQSKDISFIYSIYIEVAYFLIITTLTLFKVIKFREQKI